MSRTSAEDISTQAVSPVSILGGAGAAAAGAAGAGAPGAAGGRRGGAGAGVCASTRLAAPSASRLIKRTIAIKRVGILTAKPPWSRERALGRASD